MEPKRLTYEELREIYCKNGTLTTRTCSPTQLTALVAKHFKCKIQGHESQCCLCGSSEYQTFALFAMNSQHVICRVCIRDVVVRKRRFDLDTKEYTGYGGTAVFVPIGEQWALGYFRLHGDISESGEIHLGLWDAQSDYGLK